MVSEPSKHQLLKPASPLTLSASEISFLWLQPNRATERPPEVSPPTPLNSENSGDQNPAKPTMPRRPTRRPAAGHAPATRRAWGLFRRLPVTKLRSIGRISLLSTIAVSVWPNSSVGFTWVRQLSLGNLNSESNLLDKLMLCLKHLLFWVPKLF